MLARMASLTLSVSGSSMGICSDATETFAGYRRTSTERVSLCRCTAGIDGMPALYSAAPSLRFKSSAMLSGSGPDRAISVGRGNGALKRSTSVSVSLCGGTGSGSGSGAAARLLR
eukprot:scaffold91_cov254-Pinguiococcus_pyrenoidosus.AAC.5